MGGPRRSVHEEEEDAGACAAAGGGIVSCRSVGCPVRVRVCVDEWLNVCAALIMEGMKSCGGRCSSSLKFLRYLARLLFYRDLLNWLH